MKLNKENTEMLKQILDSALTDALYTVLIGIEGSASIAEKQEMYKLYNEVGDELTGNDIEEHAWEYFHEK